MPPSWGGCPRASADIIVTAPILARICAERRGERINFEMIRSDLENQIANAFSTAKPKTRKSYDDHA
jgi:hypothetical protein